MNAHQKNAYYKYRPLYQWGSVGREPHPFTRSLIKDAEIFYSAPKDFNDPFDCNLRIHVNDSTDADWERYCDQLSAENPSRKAQMDEGKARKLWRTVPELSQDVGQENLRINQLSSVFCLSKKRNSIPMFSYYADNHRGVAVEFEFSDVEIPCGFAVEDTNNRGVPYGGKIILDDVKYPPVFPDLNYHRLRGTRALIENSIFTKHHEWAHEDEIRIFRRAVPAGVVQFEKRLLTRVIFGCNTTPEDVALVKTWLTDWPSDVVLSKAEKATAQFDLAVVDFDSVAGS